MKLKNFESFNESSILHNIADDKDIENTVTLVEPSIRIHFCTDYIRVKYRFGAENAIIDAKGNFTPVMPVSFKPLKFYDKKEETKLATEITNALQHANSLRGDPSLVTRGSVSPRSYFKLWSSTKPDDDGIEYIEENPILKLWLHKCRGMVAGNKFNF
jgi:hypothetical protein